MILLIIFISIYFISVLFLYFFMKKKYSKKHPWWIILIHALTLTITLLLENFFIILKRKKYSKKTPVILKKLSDLNIPFHIVFGTLLFSYRNNSFLDDDIDIAVFRDEFNSNHKKEIEKMGFVLSEEWYLNDELCEQTYINKTQKISMDIFHMSRDEEFAPTFDEKHNRYSRRKTSYKYQTKLIGVGGLELLAPSNPEEYLKWNYGQWRKRDSNYHWFYGSSSNPPIIIDNANIKYIKY